jgi:chaperonin GroEL
MSSSTDIYNSISAIKLDEKEVEQLGIQTDSATNVVERDKLRDIQKTTLNRVAKFISYTFGPMGSNTKIIVGNDPQNISSKYSKDGLTVLKSILFQDPIEASILEELIEITRHVEGEVGDGTTSTVILSSYIFALLDELQQKENIPPYDLTGQFKTCIDKIKDKILSYKNECTVDDIYDIAMISTNGNEQVSKDIKDIYEQFGMTVDLSVGISNDSDTKTKIYDGITITEGMSDPAFVNNRNDNTSEVPNARVYYFADPVDTNAMIGYLDAIIANNLYEKIQNDEAPIPTVICCPRISKDAETVLKQLVEFLYSYDNANLQKPPFAIITDITASDEIIMDDIANLCGCKKIKKYIDREVYAADVEKGLAPTIENIADNFYGECELVVADMKKTKFINPAHMYLRNEDGSYQLDEEGNKIEDNIYSTMIQFLEAELETTTEDASYKGTVRKRLSSLKANMVDYLVGGITIAERDQRKDLVEDAIKNCKSAAKYGVGYAANFEGLRASLEQVKDSEDDISKKIYSIIAKAYIETSKVLYRTMFKEEELDDIILKSVYEEEHPINIRPGDERPVLCSIMLDIEILDTISKIITMMVTCNQCLVQAPQLNKY